MVLSSLVFMVNSTMNLMNAPYYECEEKEYHFSVC